MQTSQTSSDIEPLVHYFLDSGTFGSNGHLNKTINKKVQQIKVWQEVWAG